MNRMTLLDFVLILLFLAVIAFALAGCATPAVTPEQLAAVAKDGSGAAVGCATGTGPWGRAGVVFVNAAQANQITGNVTVNTDCSVAISSANGATAAAPAK